MRTVEKLSASVRNTLACSRSCSTCVIRPVPLSAVPAWRLDRREKRHRGAFRGKRALAAVLAGQMPRPAAHGGRTAHEVATRATAQAVSVQDFSKVERLLMISAAAGRQAVEGGQADCKTVEAASISARALRTLRTR
jgi:hypothetical protein